MAEGTRGEPGRIFLRSQALRSEAILRKVDLYY